MTDDGPSYDDARAALASLSPQVLGVVPHVSGAGIQGMEPATYRIVVYVDRGSREALLSHGTIPASVRIGDEAAAVAVPVVIEEQDAPGF